MPRVSRLTLVLLAVVAAFVFIPHAATIFAVAFLALIFGLLLDAPVSALARHGVARGIGTVGVLVIVLGALAGVGVWLVPSVARDAKGIKALHHSLPATLAHRLNSIGRHLPVHIHVRASQLQFSHLYHYVSSHHLLSGLGEAALAVLAAVAIAVWAVAAPGLLARRGLDLLAPERREAVSHLGAVVAARLRRWLLGQCVLNLYAGVASFALFELLRVPYAPLFALAAVFLDVIPTFGVLIASAGPVLLLLADDPGHLLWLVVGLVVIYQVEDRLIIPHVMGRAADLPQAAIAFAMFVFGIVWGPAGVVMAVPVTATLMAVVVEWRAGSVPGASAWSRAQDKVSPGTAPGSGDPCSEGSDGTERAVALTGAPAGDRSDEAEPAESAPVPGVPVGGGAAGIGSTRAGEVKQPGPGQDAGGHQM